MAKQTKTKQLTKTAAIYARFSSHLQRDESIDQQVNECRLYAASNGIEIVTVYADEAMSGRNDRRPQFQKMKRDAARGEFTHILAYKSNRLARNMFDALRFESEMQELGIDVLYAKEEFGNNAAGRFALRTMMNVNQFYSENMGEDIKRALYDNVRLGKVNGVVPLGYQKNAAGMYEIVPDEAEIVREVFRRVSTGEARSDIIADLNARGVSTNHGGKWQYNSISRMCANKKYMGVYEFGEMIVEDAIPPIVEKAQFVAANERLKEHKVSRGCDDGFILSGKLFCGLCGSRMIGVSGTSKSGEPHYYYICKTARRGECEKKAVRKDETEYLVAERIAETISDGSVVQWIANVTMQYQHDQDQSAEKQLVTQQLADVKSALKNIISAIEKGIFNDTTQARMRELEERRHELELNLVRIESQEIHLSREEIVACLSSFVGGDLNDPDFRKRLIKTFVSRAVLFDDYIKVIYAFNGKESVIDACSTKVTLCP